MSSLSVIPPKITILDHTINMIDGLYSLNDMHKASGGAKKHQPAFFVRNQEVFELTEEIKHSANLQSEQVLRKINGGAKRGTYACKELVYRYAMWISPKFALLVIRTFDAVVNNSVTQTRVTISVEQQNAVRREVAKRCKSISAHYQTIYTRLYEHFEIPRYTELLAMDFESAIQFIRSVSLENEVAGTDSLELSSALADPETVSSIMNYLHSLHQTIKSLGGEIPEFPDFNESEIASAIITRMVQGKRMMLSVGCDSDISIKLIPQNNWIITEDNIANIIADPYGVSRSKLPDIMGAVMKRAGI